MAAPVTEHPDYLRVVAIKRSDLAERAACEALADVVATTDDPLVALYASALQISKTREQGTHEAAVLLLAETLDRIDDADFTRATVTFKRDVMIGLANGVSSALDVAEVDFAAVDDLFAKLEDLAVSIGVRPYLLWERRIRRYAMSGDDEQAERWINRVVPFVNYTNRFRYGLDCPSCALGFIAWLRGPKHDIAKVEAILHPVFAGNTRYPGEDNDLLAAVFDNGPAPQCDTGLQLASASYGRSLVWAGRFAEARTQLRRALSFGPSDICLMPEIANIELAIAAGTKKTLEREVAELSPRAAKHEDVEERFLVELRVLQAERALGGNPSATAAEISATRLDRRLGRSSHVPRLARELLEGPEFPVKSAARQRALRADN